jgi:hypothetical protein
MRHQLWHFGMLQHISYFQGDDTKPSIETRRIMFTDEKAQHTDIGPERRLLFF